MFKLHKLWFKLLNNFLSSLSSSILKEEYPSEIRNRVGLVFQDFALFDDFSPKENMLLSFLYSLFFQQNPLPASVLSVDPEVLFYFYSFLSSYHL